MKFAAPLWLLGATGSRWSSPRSLVLGGVLACARERRLRRRERRHALVTARAGGRRALKGVLLVLAVASRSWRSRSRSTAAAPAHPGDEPRCRHRARLLEEHVRARRRPSRIARAKAEVAR